jgi:AraC-like DNA-binding protein/mannose-6-phosphate isomerase-like protein (cupin superfamily)
MKQIPTHKFRQIDKSFAYVELKDFMSQDKHIPKYPHRHNYYEVFIFTKGGGTHMIDFVEYSIKANSLHFISPGMVHSIRRNAGCVGLVITFTKELFAMQNQQNTIQQINLYHNNQFPPIIECNQEDMRYYRNLIHKIKDESISSKLMGNEMALAYLIALLIHANRKFVLQHQLLLPQIFTDIRVQEFKNLLNAPLIDKPSVSSFAAKMGITAKQLNQLLMKHTGLNPKEHITNQILIEAKRLLINSDLTIKEIAYELFFDDPAYFGRIFKNQIGQTPNQYRKVMRKKYQNL